MKRTYAIALVYADGNPFDIATGLSALDAAAELAVEEEKYAGSLTPHVFCHDADDPERGHFDFDRLIEEVEDEADRLAAQEWPEYAQAIEDEANGPDFTAEELRGR